MILKTKSLPLKLLNIIRDKDTEYPNTGEYNDLTVNGTYLCRQCGLALYRADNKFTSHCGWPSFDKEIENSVLHETDADGMRTEILCSRCNAHLGHVFKGEGYTALNTRHCVNSSSLDFVENENVLDTQEAIFAAGCFWGVEYYFKKLKGVLKAEVGYSGGLTNNPTYEQICSGDTGHFEAIRVVFDPKIITYEDLLKYFFEIHDFTQINGQGPDIGEQYLSACFYYNEEQKITILNVISLLKNLDFKVATKILPVAIFWKAESYHQNYYDKTGHHPYCHRHTKIFD